MTADTIEGGELKPCPFCGWAEIQILPQGDRWWMVRCTLCGANKKQITEHEEQMVAEWNTRTPSPPASEPGQAEVEREDVIPKWHQALDEARAALTARPSPTAGEVERLIERLRTHRTKMSTWAVPIELLRDLDAAVAALSTPATPAEGMVVVPREAWTDLETHQTSWRNALVLAWGRAEVRPPDIDDKAYWKHEIAAFDRTFASLLSAAPKPDGGER